MVRRLISDREILQAGSTLIGSFHRVSIKHVHRYLTEFEYRFNARKDVHIFEKTVAEMLKGQPMPMKELTANA